MKVFSEDGEHRATIHLVEKPSLQAYAKCVWCQARVTRTLKRGGKAGQGRPYGFLACWGGMRCPGPAREHFEKSERDPGTEQVFTKAERLAARRRLQTDPEYEAMAGRERSPGGDEGSEPDIFWSKERQLDA